MKYRNRETVGAAAYAGAGVSTPRPEEVIAGSLAGSAMRIEVEGDTLRVRGDIDLYHAERFRQQAEAHLRSVPQPLLDLTQVAFLDSAGLAALLALSREAKAQGKMLRVAIAGSPRRVLRITGIDRILTLDE